MKKGFIYPYKIRYYTKKPSWTMYVGMYFVLFVVILNQKVSGVLGYASKFHFFQPIYLISILQI